MKRPIYDNWVYLVSLLRGEKLRQLEMGGSGSSGGERVEKSLADELTVFEAEEVDEEEEEKDSTMKHHEVEEEQHQPNTFNNNIGSNTTPTSSEIDIPETVAKTFIKRRHDPIELVVWKLVAHLVLLEVPLCLILFHVHNNVFHIF